MRTSDVMYIILFRSYADLQVAIPQKMELFRTIFEGVS
jgi:hypothetical protein